MGDDEHVHAASNGQAESANYSYSACQQNCIEVGGALYRAWFVEVLGS